MALSFGPLYRDFKKELDKNRQTQQIMRQEQVSGVRPMFKAPEMPQQSTWDKVRDIFDANTDADVYRRFQSGQDNNAPRQSNLDKIRDVFDANTALDRYNRIKAGQSADYVQQQKELGNPNATTSPIPSVLTNFIQGTTKTLGLAGRAGELTPEEAARNQKLFDEGSQTTMQLRPTVAVKGPNGETVYASKNPVTSRNITEQFSTPQNAAEAAYLYGTAGAKAKLMLKNPFGGKTLLGKMGAEGLQNVTFNAIDQLTADDKRSIQQKAIDSVTQAPEQFLYGIPYGLLPGQGGKAKVKPTIEPPKVSAPKVDIPTVKVQSQPTVRPVVTGPSAAPVKPQVEAPEQFAYGVPYAALPGITKGGKMAVKAVSEYEPKMRAGFVKIPNLGDDAPQVGKTVDIGGVKLRPETVDINTLKTSNGVVLDKELTDAIKENGVVPLLVDKNNMIYEGQHRLESLKALGEKNVPIYRVDMADINKMSDDTKMAFLDKYNLSETRPVAPQVGKTDNIVYHGKGVGGSETGDRYGKGLYVTSDKKRASGYANGGAVDEYSLDGLKLANLDDKVDSKIVDILKREINDSIKNGDDYYKNAIRMSVGEKTFSKTDIASARNFVDEQRAIASKLGLGEDSMPITKKNSDGSFTITYVDDTLESLKNIDGNRLFRSLPTPTAQSLFTAAGFDGVSYRGLGGDIESVVYNGKLNKSTPPQVGKALKGETPKTGFSRAGDSIDMSRYKPTEQTPEQARIADMAKRTGISESTLIREASRRGGIDKIEGVASSLTDDITARSKDAVFTAKLKDTVPVVKQSQKPEVTAKLPVREDVPYDIDPVTGGYRNLQDMIDNAPDAKKVSGIQAQEITGAVVSQVDRGMDAVDNILKARGSSFEDMARAVQQANRNNLPVPAEFKAEYDMVKQLLDRLRGASSKQMGKQEAYLPQFRAQDNPQVQVGKSLVDLVDVEDFGFSAQRKNLIPLEELDYSKEGIKKYATQAMSYKYRDAIDIEALKQRVKQTDGIDLTDVKARDVLKKTKDLAEEANKAAETPGEIQKLKVVDKIEDIAKTKGKQRIDVLQDVSWAKGQVLDSQVLAGNVTVRTKTGKKDSLFNVLGLKRYRDAEGLAKQVLMPAVEGSDDVSKTLSEYIKKTGAPEATHDAMVMRTVRDLQSVESGGKYYIDPKTFSPEEYVQLVLEQKQAILTKFEKNIARETLIDGLETYNLKGKGMRKLIDYHARHMLTDGRYTKTAADKMTNFIVGTYYRGALGYNPASAILNLLELQRVTSLVGIKDGAEAIRKAIADWNITKRYGVHESSYENLVELQKQRGLMEKTSLGKKIENYSGIMKLFEWTERIKDASTLHALEAVYAKKGLTGEALTNAVLNDFNKYAIKGGQFGSVGLYKTKTGRTLGQFMQYPLKDLQITGNMIKKAFGSDITQQRDAQKYLARLLVQRTITYMVLNAAIGTSAEVAFGIFNPVRQSRIDSEASNAEKVVSYIPGGPAIDMLKDIYISYQQAMRQAERTGENVELGDVANKEVKKNLTLFVPGGNQLINKTGIQHLFGDNPASDFFPQGYFGDEKRGYNESTRIGLQGQEKSKARFATPEEGNLLDRAKGAVFGPYSTDEAREYFGSKVGSDIPFIGGAFQGERFSPVSARQQERIEAGGNPRELIAEDRVNQQARKKFFADNPNLKGVYDEMTKVTYNKDTNKYESDIITPEKWAKVYGDSSLKLYDYLKQRAEANNRQFGDPIDPIYQLKDKGQIKTVLELRSTFTGDEKEPEEILKAKSPWYVDFKKAEAAYYDAQSKRAFTEDADYGMSERKKQYLELGKQYPQNTALIQKYYDTKAENPDAAKEFYKANADQLSADFDALKRQKLDWINAKRKLEGAPPISWDAYQNVTFGYEDDEDRVAKSLYFKNGSGYGGSRQVSMKAPETYGTELRAGVTIKKQPVKKLAQSGKVKKVTIAKPKVSMKKSKV